MVSFHSNCFHVVINISQVPIELSFPTRKGGGGEIAQLICKV